VSWVPAKQWCLLSSYEPLKEDHFLHCRIFLSNDKWWSCRAGWPVVGSYDFKCILPLLSLSMYSPSHNNHIFSHYCDMIGTNESIRQRDTGGGWNICHKLITWDSCPGLGLESGWVDFFDASTMIQVTVCLPQAPRPDIFTKQHLNWYSTILQYSFLKINSTMTAWQLSEYRYIPFGHAFNRNHTFIISFPLRRGTNKQDMW
jgi:hypothetical protein